MDKGYGKSKAQKAMAPKNLYLKIVGLTCIELDCERLSR